MCVLRHSVVSDSLQPTRLLWPCDFSGQESWSVLPLPPPGDLPDPGVEPESAAAPALAGGVFITEAPK